MKSSFALFVLTSCAGWAAPQLPEFSSRLEPAPNLFLEDEIQAGRVPLLSPDASLRRAAPAKAKVVSRMPVIAPNDGVDPNMPIVSPKGSIDYRMTVKPPAVVPAE